MLPCQRHLFRLPDGLHYLNCAYMSPLARPVEEAGLAGLRRKRDPTSIAAEDFFTDVARARQRFGRLVGADPARIAVIPSVSYGIAAAVRNTLLTRGQNVVVTAGQFPSNWYAWRRAARAAEAELRIVAAPTGPGRAAGWNARLLDAIDDRTAAVALGQIHWTDGSRFDLEAIGARCRGVGAALVVDGTQSVGAMPFDVSRLQPDALVCAAYKWLLGPYAIGLAYFGPRYDGGTPLEETWLARPDSEDFRGLVEYRDGYRPGAARFDMGEASNFILMPMLVAALDQLLAWGVENIAEACGALTAQLLDRAEALGYGVEEATGRAPHLVGLRLPRGQDPEVLAAALSAKRIAVSVRGEALRVAPHVYNDADDIAALVTALEETRGAALRTSG